MARRGAGGRPRMDGVVAHGSAREMSTCLAGGAEEGAAEMEPELSGWCGAVGIFFRVGCRVARTHNYCVDETRSTFHFFYYSNQQFTSQQWAVIF
jgi:hypothetical protein